METKLKTTNGITLIALIITIIVLLILAGVALATLTGQGNIIGNAENAVGKYNNSVAEEQQLLNEIEKHFQNYLEGGNGGSTNPEEHYGGEVTNYTTPSGDPNVKWRIFYADEENVYLIASDYIHLDYAPESANNTLYDNGNGYRLSFNNVFTDYNTGAANITDSRITKWINYVKDNSEATGVGIQSVAFMLDEARWSAKYANPEYAEYAIGGPTLELWCASYKETHDRYVECSYDDTGYLVKWSDSTSIPYHDIYGVEDEEDLYYIKSNTDKCSYMWLASPSALNSTGLLGVGSTGYVYSYYYYDHSNAGFRPLVCLKSGIQLEKQNDGTYLIK